MPETTIAPEQKQDGPLKAVPPAFSELASETFKGKPDKATEKPPEKTEKAPAKTEAKADEKKPANVLDSLLDEKPEKPEEYVEPESIKFASQKTREDFKRLSDELHLARKALKEVESKPPRQDESSLKQLEALQKERDDYAARVEKLELFADPDFNGRYREGIEKNITSAAERIKDAEGDVAAFKRAMRLSGRARDEAIETVIGDLPTFDQRRIMDATREVERLESERDSKTANPQETLKALQAERETKDRQASERDAKERRSRFEKITGELPQDFVLLRKVNGESPEAQEHNARVDTFLKGAERLLFGEGDQMPTYDEYVKAAILGSTAEKYQELFKTERAARIQSEKRLKELTESETKGGGGGGESDAPMSFAERAIAARRG